MRAAGAVGETVSFRSMLARGDERALVEVKGVDDAYPLYGQAEVEGVDEPGRGACAPRRHATGS